MFLSAGQVNERPGVNILVKFAAGAGDDERRQIIAAHGLSERGKIDAIGVDLLTVAPGESPQAVAKNLKGLHPQSIEYAEVDQVLAPTLTPDDPLYPDQWSHTNINSEAAWDVTTGAPGVVVSVLDTGINEVHEDFGTGRFLPGWNTYDNNSNTSDEYGHGTRVTGTLAAVGNNAVGVAGVNWGTSLRPVRVSAASGGASYGTIAQGIIYAADQGDRIATIEYLAWPSQAVIDAAGYMQTKNGLVCISSGNDAQVYHDPESPELIVVGSNTPTDTRAGWSTQGNVVDVVAPGIVTTTNSGGGYVTVGGTSFSTPQVAGLLALMLAANPDLPNVQVERLLFETVADILAPGRDVESGWGRIDAAAAVNAARDAVAEFIMLGDSVSAITNTTATVAWATNFSATGQLAYGSRANALRSIVTKDATATSQSVSLTHLKKNANYYYQITATAEDGRVVTSPVNQFRTLNVRGGGGPAVVTIADAAAEPIYTLTAPAGGDWFESAPSQVSGYSIDAADAAEEDFLA